MTKIANSYIKGMGYYVPDKIINNAYFTDFMDTSDQWIRDRTGIEERRFVDNGDGPADIAIPAVETVILLGDIPKPSFDVIK